MVYGTRLFRGRCGQANVVLELVRLVMTLKGSPTSMSILHFHVHFFPAREKKRLRIYIYPPPKRMLQSACWGSYGVRNAHAASKWPEAFWNKYQHPRGPACSPQIYGINVGTRLVVHLKPFSGQCFWCSICCLYHVQCYSCSGTVDSLTLFRRVSPCKLEAKPCRRLKREIFLEDDSQNVQWSRGVWQCCVGQERWGLGRSAETTSTSIHLSQSGIPSSAKIWENRDVGASGDFWRI